MTDLIFPHPSEFALEKQPGINADLIRESVTEGRLDYLISLFDSQRRALMRAEALSVAYFNQMIVLHDRLEATKRGELSETPRRRAEPRETPKAPVAAKAVELDLAIDI